MFNFDATLNPFPSSQFFDFEDNFKRALWTGRAPTWEDRASYKFIMGLLQPEQERAGLLNMLTLMKLVNSFVPDSILGRSVAYRDPYLGVW